MSGLVSCDIKTAIQTAIEYDADQAIMFCGPHGVGKSEAVYQIARLLRDDIYKDEEVCVAIGNLLKNEAKMGELIHKNGGKWSYSLGLPVIERRLSQMSEGELTGVPRVTENPILGRNTTKFTEMDFLATAFEFPVVVFFDELNRSFTSLRQGTFQIADSKAFLGNKLHKNSRVFVAANIGPLYQAEDFDIAEFSRYAVFMINYNSEVWLEWARNKESGVHPLVVDFISKDIKALYIAETNNFQPNNKYQDPRAWTRVGRLLTKKEQEGKLIDLINSTMLFNIVGGLVGQEEGQKFSSFCKENAFFFGVRDILNDWPEVSRKLPPNRGHSADRRRQIIMELFHKVQRSYEDLDMDLLTEKDPRKIENFLSFISEVQEELISSLVQRGMSVSNNEKFKSNKKEVNQLFWVVKPHLEALAKKAHSSRK